MAIRKLIVEICRRLHLKGLLSAADGNISYRLSDERILITPRGKYKDFLEIPDIAVVDLRGKVISGEPSSELEMHLKVYNSKQSAVAVVHAHPPTAIAWSIAHPDQVQLPLGSMSELIIALGEVPIVPYALPGSHEMSEGIAPYLDHKVMILSRHGGLSWGDSLLEAYNGIDRLEHSCLILAKAKSMGLISELPAEEILRLKKLREQLGNKVL